MEFTINRVYFTKRLEELQKIIDVKSHIPILAGLKIVLKTDSLILTAGNGDVFTQITIDKDNEEAKLNIIKTGETIAASSQLVIQFFKKANSEIVTFTVADGKILLKGGRAKLNNGVTDDVSMYPTIPTFSEDNKFIIKGYELKKLIVNTVFASATTESRPILTGVNFILNDKGLQLLSTDSHRLSRVINSEITFTKEVSFVVPSKTLKDLQSLLDDEADISVFFSSNHIGFEFGNVKFTGRLLEGKYPDTSRLIPVNPPIEIKLNKKDFVNAVSLISIVDSQTETVKLDGSSKYDGILKLQSGYGDTGFINDEIEVVSYVGDDILISLKTKYVLDALKQFDSEEVVLEINGSMRPILIVSPEETHITQLILPMRTL